jgi:predicted RNase H-like nuclease (RuvC/YqgF family)
MTTEANEGYPGQHQFRQDVVALLATIEQTANRLATENEALRQTITAKDQAIRGLETDLVRLRNSLRGAFS